MTVTQTVDIPASRRLTIDVPREVPPGPVILTFTPKTDAASDAGAVAEADTPYYEGECPICAAHRDPVTGEELFNAKTVAAIEESRAMMRGEIPAKRFKSLDEMWEDIMRDNDDDDDEDSEE